ncbi:MAG: hypothetical protein HY865_22690 [Chloroflexi bacterium]|nr:hypothetical protein [Chloroflexota bacterium]
MDTRVCTQCGLEKPIEQFPMRSRLSHLRQSYCYDCSLKLGSNWYERNKEYQKENAKKHRDEYRQKAKEFVWDYLSSHPCTSCGESDPHALEFHHARGNKESEVSRMVGNGTSIETIKAEIEKCDVLCANCHRKLTGKERGWFRR